MAAQPPDTSLGLLSRVQAGDAQAWSDFADRCYNVMRSWCRWQRLNETDADDIVQNSMLIVMQKVGAFRHTGRGSLRNWLKAIAWRCRCKAMARVSGRHYEELRRRYDAAVDDIGQLEQQYEQLYEASLLQQAMLLVQQRVRQATWTAFHRTVCLGESCAAVADEMNLRVYVVYSARSRIQKLIEEEVKRLAAREVSSSLVMEIEAFFRAGGGAACQPPLPE